ncbi:hypothetical protein BCU70_10235 [Vibrio sp. 10N.286.49.C2]|uniref:hypothetical protein n=1 Tax=unclassified Vibrio TaxID=2614977 RepID=UPI000C827CD4|nr:MULTISPECIES: hypothetical protein [unclassified Vibrio]PMH25419.1 hypothetical protein BCU70_10235 [Vibrio sp. 10N.286.49.C2]PMH51275.1 hypothetical protein BCU66_17180 [Vibrio sp. 10N.286.49.B1]
MRKQSVFVLTLLSTFLYGCGANTTQGAAEGAAVGAVSAGMLGALTDLIVDGEVDTYRLSRNVTAGALAGGTAGAVDGYSKDQQEEAKQAAQTVKPTKPTKPTLDFGPDVDASVNALVSCQYDAAFRSAIAAEKASQQSYQEAGIAMQALIDYDRNNASGVDVAVNKFVKISSSVDNADDAKTQLASLHQELLQERQIAGKPAKCN